MVEEQNKELHVKLKSTSKQVNEAMMHVSGHDKVVMTTSRLREEIANLKRYQVEMEQHHDEEKANFEMEVRGLKEDKLQLEAILHTLRLKLDSIKENSLKRQTLLEEQIIKN